MNLPEVQAQTEKRKAAGHSAVDTLIHWCLALLIALILALVLSQGIFVNAYIPSESMENTISVGDRVIGLRTSYLAKNPERFDLVIFRFPDDETQLFVKRVIGLPGEEVRMEGGMVYIDGSDTPLDYRFVKGSLLGDFGPVTVPENSFFMLGDNRNASWDSRYWDNTFVTRRQIVAKAAWRIWPDPCALGEEPEPGELEIGEPEAGEVP